MFLMLSSFRFRFLIISSVLLVSFFLFHSCEKETPDPPLVETLDLEEISFDSALAGGRSLTTGGAPSDPGV